MRCPYCGRSCDCEGNDDQRDSLDALISALRPTLRFADAGQVKAAHMLRTITAMLAHENEGHEGKFESCPQCDNDLCVDRKQAAELAEYCGDNKISIPSLVDGGEE